MDALPPYALAEPVFPLRALAIATSRAPLGGVRESLMATLVAARLAAASRGPVALSAPLRAERAGAARHWMGALTLGAPLRAALGQLLDATVRDDAPALAAALANVTEVTAPHLDRKARSELDRLTRSIGA
ncbi:MAG: hypothetical protein WC700_12250 [Gemmatimonadaceae bacterium]|jgi:hypothetical protein